MGGRALNHKVFLIGGGGRHSNRRGGGRGAGLPETTLPKAISSCFQVYPFPPSLYLIRGSYYVEGTVFTKLPHSTPNKAEGRSVYHQKKS